MLCVIKRLDFLSPAYSFNVFLNLQTQQRKYSSNRTLQSRRFSPIICKAEGPFKSDRAYPSPMGTNTSADWLRLHLLLVSKLNDPSGITVVPLLLCTGPILQSLWTPTLNRVLSAYIVAYCTPPIADGYPYYGGRYSMQSTYEPAFRYSKYNLDGHFYLFGTCHIGMENWESLREQDYWNLANFDYTRPFQVIDGQPCYYDSLPEGSTSVQAYSEVGTFPTYDPRHPGYVIPYGQALYSNSSATPSILRLYYEMVALNRRRYQREQVIAYEPDLDTCGGIEQTPSFIAAMVACEQQRLSEVRFYLKLQAYELSASYKEAFSLLRWLSYNSRLLGPALGTFKVIDTSLVEVSMTSVDLSVGTTSLSSESLTQSSSSLSNARDLFISSEEVIESGLGIPTGEDSAVGIGKGSNPDPRSRRTQSRSGRTQSRLGRDQSGRTQSRLGRTQSRLGRVQVR